MFERHFDARIFLAIGDPGLLGCENVLVVLLFRLHEEGDSGRWGICVNEDAACVAISGILVGIPSGEGSEAVEVASFAIGPSFISSEVQRSLPHLPASAWRKLVTLDFSIAGRQFSRRSCQHLLSIDYGIESETCDLVAVIEGLASDALTARFSGSLDGVGLYAV